MLYEKCFCFLHNTCDTDIDECEGGEGWEGEGVECEGDTFCENTPGSYRCKACHVACVGGCKGAGPGNCFECKSGFNLEDDECRGECVSVITYIVVQAL